MIDLTTMRQFHYKLLTRIELVTSSLPRMRTTDCAIAAYFISACSIYTIPGLLSREKDTGGNMSENLEKTEETVAEVTEAETKEGNPQETKNEADDYAALRAQSPDDGSTEVRETVVETFPAAAPGTEEEDALSVLKESRDLLKKQVKLGRIRTITGIVAAIFFAIGVVFLMVQVSKAMDYVDAGMALANHVVEQIDVAMGTVDQIEELIDQIGDKIESLDLGALNETFENLSRITEDITTATDSLRNFTDALSNFRLFGR